MQTTIEKNFNLEIRDNVGILTFNSVNSKVNTLNSSLLIEFENILKEISENIEIKSLIIISGKKDSFIVGADINEIKNINNVEVGKELCRKGQNILNRLSRLRMTTIAAINGSCMGGGLELTLACDYRIATNNPKTILSLPEIKLGLIPGLGGTQRLPRLTGLQQAIEMIVSGKNIRSKKALQIGLVDEVVPYEILFDIAFERATEFSKKNKLIATEKSSSSVKEWLLEETRIGKSIIAKKALEKVIENTKGKYPAPKKALEVIIEGYSKDLDKGLEIEAQAFGEMCESTVSKNLISIFENTNQLKKPYNNESLPKIKKIGLLGAGLMGSGIAKIALEQDIIVRIKDISFENIGKALKSINEYFQISVDKKIISPYDLKMKVNKVSGCIDYSGFKRVDFVIEAIFEDLSLKQKMLGEIESIVSENCIIATNTSGIPISEIAKGLKHPERLIGMHFFSPVEKMPLIEVIVTPYTPENVIAQTVELGKKMGKTVIIVNDGLGFYTTRVLTPYLNEALHILLEGGSIQQIDKVMTDFGFPVGPFKLLDEVGIDVGTKVIKLLNPAFPRMQIPEGLDKMESSNRLGKKNNKGFYNYSDNSKDVDITVYDDLELKHKRAFTDEEIKTRLVMSFLNEAAYCLEDNILHEAKDGDIGSIFGLGFPPFLGGPFRYMDNLGLTYVHDKLESLNKKYGERFKPSKIISDLAINKKTFYNL